MLRTILAVIAGGLALFFWSFLSWVVLPLHLSTTLNIPQEESVLAAMQTTMTAKGVYFFPGMTPGQENDAAAMEAWTAKYRSGPTGFIVYDPAGGEPFDPPSLALSLLFEFFAVAVGLWFFTRSTAPLGGYFARATYFGMIGILLSLAVYIQEWIHLKFPLPYILAFCTDAVAGWLLAGLVIAAILRPLTPAGQQQ